jgi:opacity protein-like surface antigen
LTSARFNRLREVFLSRVITAALLIAIVASAAPSAAEPAPPQPPTTPTAAHPDFFFGAPRGWIGGRGSWVVDRASGDLFAFVRDQLTLRSTAFNRPAFGGQVGINVGPRVAVTADIDWGRSSSDSEYRHFIGTDQLPVAQTTELTQSNVSLSLRFDLTSSGRSISRLAWIPHRFVPFVGAGAGVTYYDFTQTGDFVDYVDLAIFRNTFSSSGWTTSTHVLAGADVAIWRKLSATFEARYLWAHAPLETDFQGFDGIDLSGFRWTTGVNVMF